MLVYCTDSKAHSDSIPLAGCLANPSPLKFDSRAIHKFSATPLAERRVDARPALPYHSRSAAGTVEREEAVKWPAISAWSSRKAISALQHKKFEFSQPLQFLDIHCIPSLHISVWPHQVNGECFSWELFSRPVPLLVDASFLFSPRFLEKFPSARLCCFAGQKTCRVEQIEKK